MTHLRQAVDSTAKDYWTKYFGDYGKAWVRDIPHRVSAALAAEINVEAARKAGGRPGKPPALVVAPAGPRSYAVRPDGGLSFEGFARGAGITRLFKATFSADGALSAIESRTLPVGA